MNVYVVGGAVRDRMMGRTPKDLDYVVVGETPQSMLDRGFSKVGADFPVFLHPQSGDEYALARTERSTGDGYYDFVTDYNPNVTLEEDLARRDLTMNAMAVPLAHWDGDDWDNFIIDPFEGRLDIAAQLLRHTTEAFKEDPLRVLRVARFAARYDFDVHWETHSMMVGMYDMLTSLVPERVWGELSRALMEEHPWKFFDTLEDCGVLRVVFPHFDLNRILEDVFMISFLPIVELSRAARHNLTLEQRYAMVASNLTPQQHSEMKVPTECSKLASAVGGLTNKLVNIDLEKDFVGTLDILKQLKIRQQPEFADLVFDTIKHMLFEGDHLDRDFMLGFEYEADYLRDLNTFMKSIDYEAIVNKAKEDKVSVPQAVLEKELWFVEQFALDNK